MTEERFFNEVRNRMENFSPEVPASVYSGMRKKMWWSNFTRFRAGQLNVWYVAALSGAALLWLGTSGSGVSSPGMAADIDTPVLKTAAPVIVQAENTASLCTGNVVNHKPAHTCVAIQSQEPSKVVQLPVTPAQPEPEVTPPSQPTPDLSVASAGGDVPPAPEITVQTVKKGWGNIPDDMKTSKTVTVKTSKDRR